ncbi:hypothetical protein CA13_03430 [Planctomycetes bacterium CA13]|uniref:Uncharacterized protein n=1 Tax=Novipirellula herctigrandis TaxID=2527986 RepID=A0A5C5YW07_9BACT|nr:hypothetical protein CA13_03430 [Planctomycetes bacterium CA13]
MHFSLDREEVSRCAEMPRSLRPVVVGWPFRAEFKILEKGVTPMGRFNSLTHLCCVVACLVLFSGCGGETSVQKAPEGSTISQYLAENPDVLAEENLDAADDAEMDE